MSDADGEGTADAPRRERSARDARRLALAGLSLMALVAVAGMWAPWREEDPVTEKTAAGSAYGSTTTSVLTADGPVAPLTGAAVSASDAANLLRPALVAKIDAAAASMPQTGLRQADLVIELRVEGISRHMAVWHSTSPEAIGPVRSARTSDPDLLALFGHPLFAFSGANQETARGLRSADWFQDVSHDSAESAYHRSTERAAPHNLMAEATALWARADQDVSLPNPLFAHRPPGEPASGAPAAGLSVEVGSESQFAWDDRRRGWLKWSYGVPHVDEEGLQLAPTNVVVLETDYTISAADAESPEAVSVGTGRAWVFSDGKVAEGTWSRPDRTAPWDLRSPDGSPLLLEAGPAWVALSSGVPVLLSTSEVAELPTG